MDLDSILDQALDDFEEQELQEKTAAASSSTSHQRDGEIDANDLEAERIQGQAQLASFLQSLQDPSYGQTLQNVSIQFKVKYVCPNTLNGFTILDSEIPQFNLRRRENCR